MISEFQDLSDKIDRLAQLTQSLRAEIYLLRQANGLLGVENRLFKERLLEAERRVEALLGQLPAPEGVDTPDAPDADDAGPDAGEPNEATQ